MSNSNSRQPLVLIPQYFGSLIFDRRNSRYTPFDQAATDLLIQSIERRIDQVLAEVPRSQLDTTLNFFEHFQKADYFSVDGRLMAETLKVTPPQDHLTGPLAAHLEIIGMQLDLQTLLCWCAPKKPEPCHAPGNGQAIWRIGSNRLLSTWLDRWRAHDAQRLVRHHRFSGKTWFASMSDNQWTADR